MHATNKQQKERHTLLSSQATPNHDGPDRFCCRVEQDGVLKQNRKVWEDQSSHRRRMSLVFRSIQDLVVCI